MRGLGGGGLAAPAARVCAVLLVAVHTLSRGDLVLAVHVLQVTACKPEVVSRTVLIAVVCCQLHAMFEALPFAPKHCGNSSLTLPCC
jgi:hypothetical protein